MNDTELRQHLVRLGLQCGLQVADAEDVAHEAMNAAPRATENRLNYARKTVRNLASKIRKRQRRSAPFNEETVAASLPELPSELAANATEQAAEIARIDSAIEQIAFWGCDGGLTSLVRPGGRCAGKSVFDRFRYYECVLKSLPVYTDRHRRNLRSDLLQAIRRVVSQAARAKNGVASEAPPLPPLGRPPIVERADSKATTSTRQTVDETRGSLLCMRFDVTAVVATPEGRRSIAMIMFWFGAWSEIWAREVSSTELAALTWPGPGEFRLVHDDDGEPLCVLGDTLWRGVELVRRLAPRASDQVALRTALDAYRTVYGTGGLVAS